MARASPSAYVNAFRVGETFFRRARCEHFVRLPRASHATEGTGTLRLLSALAWNARWRVRTFRLLGKLCALASAFIHVLREFQQWPSRFADGERLVLRSSFAPYLVVSVGFRPRSRRVRSHATVKSHLARKASQAWHREVAKGTRRHAPARAIARGLACACLTSFRAIVLIFVPSIGRLKSEDKSAQSRLRFRFQRNARTKVRGQAGSKPAGGFHAGQWRAQWSTQANALRRSPV